MIETKSLVPSYVNYLTNSYTGERLKMGYPKQPLGIKKIVEGHIFFLVSISCIVLGMFASKIDIPFISEGLLIISVFIGGLTVQLAIIDLVGSRFIVLKILGLPFYVFLIMGVVYWFISRSGSL